MMKKTLFGLFCLVFLSCSVPIDVEVSCDFMESCVLPCPFTPGDDPVIHWTKEPGDTPVHSYFRNQHQLHLQHENYRGRTFLSDQGISRGNASLQLHKVNVSDEGRYRCFVGTIRPDNVKEYFVHLKVHAPVLEVSMEQQEQQLLCRSEGIYPEPSVVWTPSIKHNTRVTKSEQGLFSVVSSVLLSDSEDKHICNISAAHSWRSVTYRNNRDAASGNRNLLYLWILVLIPVAAVVCFLIYRCCWKRSRSWEAAQPLEPAEVPLNDCKMPLEDPNMNHDDESGVFTELNETSCSVHESTDFTAPTIHII